MRSDVIATNRCIAPVTRTHLDKLVLRPSSRLLASSFRAWLFGCSALCEPSLV